MMSDEQRGPRTESESHHALASTQSSAFGPHSYEIDIEELVLHGFDARDRFSIAEAVLRELSGLLQGKALSPGLLRCGELAFLEGGSFDVAPGSRAETIGRQTARAVYERWRGAV